MHLLGVFNTAICILSLCWRIQHSHLFFRCFVDRLQHSYWHSHNLVFLLGLYNIHNVVRCVCLLRDIHVQHNYLCSRVFVFHIHHSYVGRLQHSYSCLCWAYTTLFVVFLAIYNAVTFTFVPVYFLVIYNTAICDFVSLLLKYNTVTRMSYFWRKKQYLVFVCFCFVDYNTVTYVGCIHQVTICYFVLYFSHFFPTWCSG